jgi:hypothetical protein
MLKDLYCQLRFVDAIDPNDSYREEVLNGSLLERLRECNDSNSLPILERIAETVNAPGLLSLLANDRHPEVRAAVADNIHAPEALILQLSKDEHMDVRFRVAENANTPMTALTQLADDENPYIAFRARKTINRLSLSEVRAIRGLRTNAAVSPVSNSTVAS